MPSIEKSDVKGESPHRNVVQIAVAHVDHLPETIRAIVGGELVLANAWVVLFFPRHDESSCWGWVNVIHQGFEFAV